MTEPPRRQQLDLFGNLTPPPARPRVAAVAPDAEAVRAAQALPALLRLGTSSWSFPGWQGIVYRERHSDALLSRDGLAAYAQHPLLRTVGLDRTHYAPLSAAELRRHAGQVPADFRFVVKAHEWCTLLRFPDHPRYGTRRDGDNPHFLDADYATREVVEPVMTGLADRLGVMLFQLAPQSFQAIGGDGALLDRLHAFLRGLPRGPQYAIEVRNASLLGAQYAALLRDTGAVACLSAMPRMPSLAEQWQATQAASGTQLLIRWLLHATQRYESAVERYKPFDRLVDEDPATRGEVAELIARALAARQPVLTVINNKAEGCSPLSVFRLATAVAARLAPPAP